MTDILIIGREGQLGWELQRAMAPWAQVRAVDQPEVNLALPDTYVRLLRQLPQGTVVVNAAAYTAVDRAETEPDMARRINAEAPGILAEECRRSGTLFIHYSTDFVFDGVKRKPYVEEDTPNPLNVYGRTKWAGEQAVCAVNGAHLIFRTAWLYGLRGTNFLLTVRRRATEGRPLRIVNDQVGCPTWARSLAEATVAVLQKLIMRNGASALLETRGLYHAACQGQTSWYGFAKAFLPSTVALQPIPTAEHPTAARRPPYSALDCSRLERDFGVQLPRWEEALRACLASESAPA